MLTRLKVSGFKNLVDVDVYFGPFTCVAGPNGVGKSNLFDAILFLSSLTSDRTLTEAALSVRDDKQQSGDVRSIFHRIGDEYDDEVRFEAEMILPKTGLDYLGQRTDASTTLVRYVLRIGWRPKDSEYQEAGPLEILEENLIPLRKKNISKHLLFPADREWRKSVMSGSHTRKFISTEEQESKRFVRLHQDGRAGRLLTRPASALPRTMLSTVQTGEYPTALLVRREMQSWRLLHLESSALRQPDSFTAPPRMEPNGSHLPAALYHLARRASGNGNSKPDVAKVSAVYASVANRLAELINDIRDVGVERDESKERFTLHIKARDGTEHLARALSDGTLRFLALAVTECDTLSGGLICMEEPENGIHPRRIPAMLRLLQDIATDTDYPSDDDNPLRQVIINTHSPLVVQQAPDDSVLMAELVETVRQTKEGDRRFGQLQFSCLGKTWRTEKVTGHRVTSKATLLAYLNPSAPERSEHPARRRVMDRGDLQMSLFSVQPAG
jgi:predicted ATPase